MHEIHIQPNQSKAQRYQTCLPLLASVLEGESDITANLANTAALLKEVFQWLWVGFYRVDQTELVLAPFQGPLACTRIPFERGICGRCYREQKTIIIADVNAEVDHIACSSRSQSEIVVPIFDQERKIRYVLDVDSEELKHFDTVDQTYLEQIAQLLSNKL